MARVEPLPPQDWPAGMRDALAAMVPPNPRHPRLTSEGRPKALNTLGTFAHHPDLARAVLTLTGHAVLGTTLPTRQREILVLRVATVRACAYEWAQHVLLGRDAGLDDDEIARIADAPDSAAWSDVEAALIRSVDELIGDGVISDATWAALSAELDVQQILDVIFTVGAHEATAWMMRSFDLPLDDDLPPG